MALKIGMHTGPQDLSMAELQKLWRRADAAGFHWISVWDHFYSNPLINNQRNPCFEGVAAMTALAATTSRVRVGCLMFCVPFRNPGLLAKSAVTVDHVSNGRAELGLGGGGFEEEFKEFNYDYPPIKDRLDQLEEGMQIIQGLLHRGKSDFHGKYFAANNAVCAPMPMQKKLRLWVGGRGEKRTPRIAAQYGDGFNIPYVSPAGFRERNDEVDRNCERFKRDPKSIERTINLHFLMWTNAKAEAAAKERMARMNDTQRDGVLSGSAQQVIDRIGEYDRAGAQGLNIALRPPVDWDAFELFIEKVFPVVHG
jgi:alkanesulfonate monooxygenase SsuD/methylene tetrahydromethanopterin reductase-like flavin-dependent oxidoreductase (luciferase family)